MGRLAGPNLPDVVRRLSFPMTGVNLPGRALFILDSLGSTRTWQRMKSKDD
jgi:hypothetical protein